MTRSLAVLRPEPGNAATLAQIAAQGLRGVRLPLFATRPVAWHCPDPAGFDALLLTSANALRHGGPALVRLRRLPVIAVGEATATAARAAGFEVRVTGNRDAAAALTLAEGARVLHLCGRDHIDNPVAARIIVYASEAVAVNAADLTDTVALIHSARAGARLAEVSPDRACIAVAAISTLALEAAGGGWAATVVAAQPTDAALIAAARTLAD